jgi:hypothetical protein
MAQGERIGRMTGKTRGAFLLANVTRPQDHHFLGFSYKGRLPSRR